MQPNRTKPQNFTARDKLLAAAFALIRSQGYSATTVDELCVYAKVTKGSFFHYFTSKEDLAVKAAEHWSLVTSKFFESASYHKLADPLDRFIGYLEFRKKIISGSIPEFTCLVGTMVQEAYHTNAKIRQACQASIFNHAKALTQDIKAAQKLYQPQAKWSAQNLALHTQAVIQGAFILAKAGENSKFAVQSIDQLINYVQLLFNQPKHKGKKRC